LWMSKPGPDESARGTEAQCGCHSGWGPKDCRTG
jgi:hypothetical protein